MSVGLETSGQRAVLQSFGIRKAFLIPLALVAALLAILLAVVLCAGGGVWDGIILAAILVSVSLVFWEAKSRRVSLSEGSIRLRKFGRTKEVAWKGVSHVGVLILRNKVYLLLTTVKGFFILSNAYERFPSLIHEVVTHADPQNVEEEVRNHMEAPQANWGIVFAAWFAVLVVAGIIFMKIFPF
jgi:hypothetical protein